MKQIDRQQFLCIAVTLNGQPAQIVGVKNDVATVRTIDPNGPSFEWSWQAVERVVKNGGNFKA